ncbi:hypothetical protein VPHK449_0026 [Vibrio phage K449]
MKDKIQYVIVQRKGNGCPTCYTVATNPKAGIEQTIKSIKEREESLRLRWNDEDYLKQFGRTIAYDYDTTHIFACSWELFEKINTRYWVSEPSFVDKETYYDMLEVLPPRRWGNNNGIDSFFMSEFTSGTVTAQYGKYKGYYFSKEACFYDKSTWLKAADLDKLIEEKEKSDAN